MNRLPYYHVYSGGPGTNLQLHSYRVAWRLWRELKKDQGKLKTSRVRERCVVIVDLLGLSLSQLLGQNDPLSPRRPPSPIKLLSDILNIAELPPGEKQNLTEKFEKFVEFYDDCRHFGATKHAKLDSLTFEQTASFVELTREIWDLLCEHFRKIHGTLLQFASIEELLDEDQAEEDDDEEPVVTEP